MTLSDLTHSSALESSKDTTFVTRWTSDTDHSTGLLLSTATCEYHLIALPQRKLSPGPKYSIRHSPLTCLPFEGCQLG